MVHTFLWRRIFALLLAMGTLAQARPLRSGDLLIIYNSNLPESKALATSYAEARGVAKERLLGLKLPPEANITRQQYDELLRDPLRAHFERARLWRLGRDAQGLTGPIENQVRCLVLVKGVPLRIVSQTATKPAQTEATAASGSPPADPTANRDEAAVDSELALCGVEGLPVASALNNPFYRAEQTLAQSKLAHLMLTARLEAPDWQGSERLFKDAIATEAHGLWGFAYIDVANKYPEGDGWLQAIAAGNHKQGLPTCVDSFNDTLPHSYPMAEAALYYGWYGWHVSGPFLGPNFHFRRGAIAVHIHSYSAHQLTDPQKNWVAPLLARGAAASLGNIEEPYLHLAHHLDIFHERLLRGWTLAEAAWAAIPVASWQGVVIGDPLYRPFLHFKEGTGKKLEYDRPFRAFRAAYRQWPDDPAERHRRLEQAAEKLKSGILAEALGLSYLGAQNVGLARRWFERAGSYYPERANRLRQDLHTIAIDRRAKRIPLAVQSLRMARSTYAAIPEHLAVQGWLDILDPPPPPPADPRHNPPPPAATRGR